MQLALEVISDLENHIGIGLRESGQIAARCVRFASVDRRLRPRRANVQLSRLDLRNSAQLAPLTLLSLGDTLSVAETGIQEVSMAASELEKARTHLGQEDWDPGRTRS